MIIKKILIIKPAVDDTDSAVTRYIYPAGFIAEHAVHICYNFSGGEQIKGGHLAEGMVIYTAEKKEMKALLREQGVTEISYADANITGKKWKPESEEEPAVDITGWQPAFDITNWVRESEINIETL